MSWIHGKPNTYDHHGCRCEECTRAKREYRQANYHRRLAEGPACIADGCGKRAGHGPLCPGHEIARKRAGEAPPVGQRPVTTYFSVHRMVKRIKGPAPTWQCSNCESRAAEWALDPCAENTRTQQGGRHDGLRFSTDPDDYWPLCVSCHRIMDNTVRNLTHLKG